MQQGECRPQAFSHRFAFPFLSPLSLTLALRGRGKGEGEKAALLTSWLLKKGTACFDKLSMSGSFLNISIPSPLVLSLSKDVPRVFQQPANPGNA